MTDLNLTTEQIERASELFAAKMGGTRATAVQNIEWFVAMGQCLEQAVRESNLNKGAHAPVRPVLTNGMILAALRDAAETRVIDDGFGSDQQPFMARFKGESWNKFCETLRILTGATGGPGQ